MSNNNITRFLVLKISLVFLLSVAACHLTSVGVHIGEESKPPVVAKSKPKGGPPPHAPAHGYRAKYNYRYYPSCYVYFDVSRKCYFYLDGDGWKVSASLPVSVRAQLGGCVNIEMDTDKPYTKFKEHKKKYPPGQLKKKKKEKWS